MPEKLKLGANHRRAISILLRQLERMCDEIAWWLEERSSVFQKLQNDLSPRQRATLRRMIDELRGDLSRAEQEIDLEMADRSRERTIRALLSAHLVNLQESNSRGLRGYGELPPEAARSLDDATGRLIDRLEQMLAVFREKP